MHAELRHTASATGYSEDAGTLLILPCGAENLSTILSYLPAPHPPVDMLICPYYLFHPLATIHHLSIGHRGAETRGAAVVL